MTSEAPKEIWTGACGKALVTDGMKRWEGDVKYIRADHAQAMVAAAYGVARNAVIVTPSSYAAPTARITLATAIDGLTPDDAQAALDALLRAERVKALREAAKWSCSIPTGVPDHYAQAVVDMNEHWKDAILALIEKETGHE